tara:strand:+ start:2079 stop:2294 length:216 start_codon:yes stop_codon:yes gene_type:complete
VCAWIDCEILARDKELWIYNEFGGKIRKLYYNPRETPHWTLFGEQGKIGATNLDNKILDYVFIKGTEIYYK